MAMSSLAGIKVRDNVLCVKLNKNLFTHIPEELLRLRRIEYLSLS